MLSLLPFHPFFAKLVKERFWGVERETPQYFSIFFVIFHTINGFIDAGIERKL
jgi:hypothetical protein